MPVFSKGNFKIDLGVVSIAGELDESDRQCAWELYCEIVSRVALVGKATRDGELVFTGEVLAESLDSLHCFFGEARGLMRRYPIGAIKAGRGGNHLGGFIAGMLDVVIRPFLEKWQASYHWWWEQGCARDQHLSPFERQTGYPRLDELQSDWNRLRRFCRDLAADLVRIYTLPDVLALSPPGLRQGWIDETRVVCAPERPEE
jgi:hypothetical protein